MPSDWSRRPFFASVRPATGSGSVRLAGGNIAIALLGNTLPTGAILVVLITMLGPISGAHFNPAVTGVFWRKKEIGPRLALAYVLAQLAGGIAGVFAAHLMFDLPILQLSAKVRSGAGQWFAEWVATFGLVVTILATLKAKPSASRSQLGYTSPPPTGSRLQLRLPILP